MYRGGLLVDLVPALDRGVNRFGRRTTEKVGDRYQKRVKHHTPVSKVTAAEVLSFGSRGAELNRGGRPRGALRDSWLVGEVDLLWNGQVFRIDVYTLDPVAPHVEWETRPHLIKPRNPSGVLTVPTAGGLVFAKVVHHPGTRGAHMLATATAEIAAEWREIARREWAQEIRGFWRAQ